MDTVQIAEKVESLIHEKLLAEADDGFSLNGATLYGVSLGYSGNENPVICHIATHPDAYDLLEMPTTAVGRMFDCIALLTIGWAAPVNSEGEVEGAPSQHPEKRRVRLVVCATRESMASVLRFQDTDETHCDEGTATGFLAEAITKFISV